MRLVGGANFICLRDRRNQITNRILNEIVIFSHYIFTLQSLRHRGVLNFIT